MAICAALFLFLREFSDFTGALYHSRVNFATLGYGDIVVSRHWRMFGLIEAANGIPMFGVSTSVMTAAVHRMFCGGPLLHPRSATWWRM